jgi:predicted CXXCH cytochrome family protein
LFRQHPPIAGVECTQCHELSRRGRFRFKDDSCFACHQQQGFVKVHSHEPSVLTECGMCHNAHGATTKAFLMQSKEASCKLCHN